MREIVFDTETTGLDPKTGDRMVEIGCVEMVNLVPTGATFHAYYNPERDMPAGAEAVQLGLATRLADDPHAAAMELAREIASKSPHAVQAGKRLVNAAMQLDDAAGFAAERAEIGALVGSPNQVESVMAYFEQRTANYADPEL